MSSIDEAKEIFDIEIEELKRVKDKLDGNFEKAINMIMLSTGKVVVSGIGKSGIIGQKIAATLASTGTLAIYMNSAEGIHGDLGMITSKDVTIIISNSGNTDEVLAILPAIKKIGAKIIAMTGNPNSKLAKSADVVIDIGVEKEACPLNLAPTSSTTVALVMGDAIASVLIKLKKFEPENFALFHPGGSLGRRLLLRVKDVMHKEEAIPKLFEDAPIDNILIEMTEKKMGAVCIVDDKNSLLGVITEGDIRRAIKNRELFFRYKASDIMTKKPISINSDKMAIDALELMENKDRQIYVLPVMENDNLVGIVRMHDLIGKI